MQCPYCKEQKDKVIDSRGTEAGTVIRRRRECLVCGKRYTTYERIEETSRLMVIKKDGSRAPYDREKVLGGVQRASWKRPISVEQLQALVSEVEEDVFRTFDREVPSSYLGNAIAIRLRDIDKVAYLRYASLYHEFEVVDDFIEEARALLERDRREVAGQQQLFQDE